MESLIEHYEKYDEEVRLTKDKVHEIEFKTTIHVLENFITPSMKIFDVGAGTGKYSFYYAKRGNEVTAIDIAPKHIKIMNEKLQEDKQLNINVNLGSAIDLSAFESESFDVILCFGPMYHLKQQQERDQCINECLRVLKKNGILAIAYINKLFITTTGIQHTRSTSLKEEFLNRVIEDGVVEAVESNDTFLTNAYFFLPTEIESYLEKFNTEKLGHVGTDGISVILNDMVNAFTEDEYSQWLKYHYKTCREPSILGYSNHGLYICRKK
jgi:2-polyprenyl-3-methyl-5-hydroxy-6-metoxy-1,4-benzoquinol methylase